MTSGLLYFQTLLALFVGVHALPAPEIESRQAITTLSAAQIASFKPFTHYASTAYCKPAQTLTWSCGANCNANPGFKPIASGGDGDLTQFCKLRLRLDLSATSSVLRSDSYHVSNRVCRLRPNIEDRNCFPPRNTHE